MALFEIISKDFNGTKRTLSAWRANIHLVNLSIDNSNGNALGIVRLTREDVQQLHDYLDSILKEEDPT